MNRIMGFVGVAITGFLVSGLGIMPVSSQVDPDPEPDIFRFSKIYSGQSIAGVSCDEDCHIQNPEQPRVVFPTSMGTIDVTVTMTLEYRTTSGVDAVISSRMTSPGSPGAEMSPGLFRLGATRRSSTTVSWSRANVLQTSGEHRFSFFLRAHPPVSAPYTVEATEVILVIEATPSEPG